MFSRDKLRYEPLALPDRVDLAPAEMEEAAAAFLNIMRRRHTVRDFSPEAVPQDVIEACVATAGSAPSGANHQPWHFAAVRDPSVKKKIRLAAEAEEANFYAGGAGEEWLSALAPIGTGPDKPHLEVAPWLIVVFAQRYGEFSDGTRYKNYYVPESVGIATGFLIAMKFLNGLLGRPESEKPTMILVVGKPAADATVPAAAKIKKPLGEILSVI
jgi:iodotyrosine deiodinase